MPKVFDFQGYTFFFFSNEGNPREPIHIHVRKDGNLAKVWIEPQVYLSENHGFTAKELKMIITEVFKNEASIRRAWNEYFS